MRIENEKKSEDAEGKLSHIAETDVIAWIYIAETGVIAWMC